MTQRPACARGTGNNKVVIALVHFLKNLINDEAVTDADLSGHAHFFQQLSFAFEIAAQLGTGSEKGTDEDYYRISSRLPKETQDYVPMMIAAGRISKDPAKYGFASADVALTE